MDSCAQYTLPAEFLERAIFLMGEVGFMQPQLGAVIVFSQPLDESVLRSAAKRLIEAEPVLACRFVPDAVPPVWELASTAESGLLSCRRSEDYLADASAFIAAPMALCDGPQVAFQLLRGDTSDALAVKVSHVAMDGGALKELLYRLAECYRKLDLKPDWRPEERAGAVRHPVADAGFFERLRALRPGDALLPPTDWGVPDLGGRGAPGYVWSELEPHFFQMVRDRGRSMEATVNDLLLASYFRVLCRLLGPAPGARTPVQISCDLRRHLPRQTTTALSNISSTWNLTLTPVGDEAFDATLRRVVRQTKAWKTAGQGKASALGVQMMQSMMRRQGLEPLRKNMQQGAKRVEGGRGYPTLTNIGVVDENRLDFGYRQGVLDALLLGPVGFPTGVVLTANTFRERLHLSVGTDFEAMEQGLAGAIVHGVVDELSEWITSTRGATGANREWPAAC